jgi:hypothetical protein
VIPSPGPETCGIDNSDDRLSCGDSGFCEPELQLIQTNESGPENDAKMWELIFLYGFTCGKPGSGAYHCEKCDDDGDCRVFVCDLAGSCAELPTKAEPTDPTARTRQRPERATETKSDVLHQAILEERAPTVFTPRQVLFQEAVR